MGSRPQQLGPLVAVVPGQLHGWQVASRGESPLADEPRRRTLGMGRRAVRLDRERVPQIECGERKVDQMATHVAQPAVAEIPPTAP